MKIALPVSNADATRLPLLVDVLLHHGNLGNHSISLYPTAVVAAAAEEAAARLRAACYDVAVHVLDNFEGGWPKAPNAHWASVVRHLHFSGNQQPWVWLEVDAVPVDQNWANVLQREYNACGKPLLGPVRQTVYRKEDGSVYHEEGDEMLLGVAVYPSWLLNVKELSPLLNDFLKLPSSAPDQPFDVYLRWAFKRMGWAHTEAIRHNWRSVEYYNCGQEPKAFGITWKTNNEESGFMQIEKMPIIIHGCKDESLYNLILNPAKTAQAPPVLAEEAPVTPQQKFAEALTEALETAAFESPSEQPHRVVKFGFDPPLPSPYREAPETPQQPLSRFLLGPVTPAEEAAWPCTKQQFEEWLGTHSKAVRLRAMLEQFGFDKLDTCRRAIGFWGYEAPTPATFIRRKK